MEIKLEVSASSLLDAEKIENGVWIHLEGAEDEDGDSEPLYAGGDKKLPIRALVVSTRSKAMRAAELKHQTTGMTKVRKADKKGKDQALSESIMLPPDKKFLVQLRALENVSSANPGVVYLDDDAKKSFYENTAYDHLVKQIQETSNSDSKYRAGASTEPGNGSASTNSTQDQMQES